MLYLKNTPNCNKNCHNGIFTLVSFKTSRMNKNSSTRKHIINYRKLNRLKYDLAYC